ncbi:sigma-54-dependent Fis family transcriptional regulator [Methylorubrum extorquens]|uniref:GAF modulated sigma54 specific transcriptional regulator, Fis family n=1 Tax=Methylorubrum extorquens (strain CM4 / NCIMB 13688) TaxID=440085 RepID=B7L355_METC4|nr:sigma-54-dependent Fis family transcriptional regulator [Methylorubrum extorquens]ACK86263.1 GAF modulated sigma54 specific transcriptional regulator, Fis family [Methylorubrum extorquens CM4]
MHNQRAIRTAWEAFLSEGRLLPGPKPAISESWERCRARGVWHRQSEAPLVGEPELFRLKSQSRRLLCAARPALQRSSLLLSEAASMMLLADTQGFIVEAAGDRRVVEEGRRNHLEEGGRWDEGLIGTNAIGTALALGRPICINGAEHFCQDVQRWSCAAAPVHHPNDGTLLGVVDISGPIDRFHPQSLAFAAALAHEVQISLGHQMEADHALLLQYFLAKRSVWLSDEILVVDHQGILVHASEEAQRRLDCASNGDLAKEVRTFIGAAEPEAWLQNCRRRFPQASVEVVRQAGEAVGCLIVLHASQRSEAQARRTHRPLTKTMPGERTVTFDEILGDSPAMRAVKERACRLASLPLPVLIEGETGVGKELFARAIKEARTPDGPFIPLNCGGMARDLVASELFGYIKGAFTGADEKGRPGKIEQADGGVLCLDEIGEMPLDLQAYLLRVLEDGIVYRIGGHEGRQVDFRLVSMTNRDLEAEIEAKRFRRDLYYRIAAVRLRIPPLRERSADVLQLAHHFIQGAAARFGHRPPRLAAVVEAALSAHPWPGNVRELRNVVEAMVAMAGRDDELSEDDLPEPLRARSVPASGVDLHSVERAAILAKLEACGGNVTETARQLGIARSTLYLRLAEFGLRSTCQR